MGRKAFANRMTVQDFHALRRAEMAATIDAMPEHTKAARARKENAKKALAREYDDGAIGRVTEIQSTTTYSHKTDVSRQGKQDSAVKWNNGVKVVTRPIERKTNGGRIGDIARKAENAAKRGRADVLIVYSMDVCNKGTSGQRRTIDPVIMPFKLFYNLLLECNAIKRTNGAKDEIAIQVTSKKLYERLLDYPIPYEPNTVYCADDFDGLEI